MDHHEVKIEILRFFESLFRISRSPFRKKKYLETYLRLWFYSLFSHNESYFYLSFIKLYQNPANDPTTLEMCTLFLRAMLAFTIQKNEKCSVKVVVVCRYN